MPPMMPGGIPLDQSNETLQRAYRQGVMPDSAIQNTIDQNLRGTLAIKLPGISGVVKFGDWRWMRIWNRICVTEGQQGETQFFAAGLGVNIVGGQRPALKIDTNQPRQGDSGLPTDWGAYIYQTKLSVEYVSGTDSTENGGQGASPTNYNPDSLDSAAPNDRILFEIERKCLFTFSANDKDRQSGHFIDYPRGGGIYANGTTDVGFNQPINGVPSPRDAHQLIVPVQLDANQQYNMTANFVVSAALDQAQVVNDRENTSLLLQCDLEGLYKVKVV